MQCLTVSDEVRDFREDRNKFGCVNDCEGWYVTEKWVKIFHAHLRRLLVIAKEGDALAQYEVGMIYFGGYLYVSEDEAMENYEKDLETATGWWIKAIQGGAYTAFHLVQSVGIGEEAERLRMIYEKYGTEIGRAPAPSQAWEKNMARLSRLAYPEIQA